MLQDGRLEEPQTTVIDHAVVFDTPVKPIYPCRVDLRSQNISGFSIDTAKQLENLELLSLSHNSVSCSRLLPAISGYLNLNSTIYVASKA